MATEDVPLLLQASDLPTVFADLTPIPQPVTAVCRIDYKPDFSMAYDYFRAVVQSKEFASERALQLTELCLRLNPANYTVWQVRRRILKEVNSDMNDNIEYDLGLAAQLGGSNPKNYQIWYHRRALLEMSLLYRNDDDDDAKSERTSNGEHYLRKDLEYIESVIASDSKNYHAWSHRQWVLLTLATTIHVNDDSALLLWQSELSYAAQLILQDVRNNSAWNHRWFVVHQNPASTIDITSSSSSASTSTSSEKKQMLLTEEAARSEAAYALECAKLDPYNESPWRYFVAVLKQLVFSSGIITSPEEKNATLQEYELKALQLQEQENEQHKKEESAQANVVCDDDNKPTPPCSASSCANLLSAVVDLVEWRQDYERVVELTERLIEVDPIRQKYWRWRGEQAREKTETIMLGVEQLQVQEQK